MKEQSETYQTLVGKYQSIVKGIQSGKETKDTLQALVDVGAEVVNTELTTDELLRIGVTDQITQMVYKRNIERNFFKRFPLE